MSKIDIPDTKNQIDLFDVLIEKVRAGKPIHVAGHFDEVLGRLQIAMINELRSVSGMSVHVIYS